MGAKQIKVRKVYLRIQSIMQRTKELVLKDAYSLANNTDLNWKK